jgi:hypothetical protein
MILEYNGSIFKDIDSKKIGAEGYGNDQNSKNEIGKRHDPH